MLDLRRGLAILCGTALVAAVGVTSAPTAFSLTMVDCAALVVPVYASVNPDTNTSLLTRSATEAKNASKYGYTQYLGEAFRASQYETTGLAGVHRLSKNGDFAYELDASRISALTSQGYSDGGVAFYAATSSDWCTQSVEVAQKGSAHRYAVGDSDQRALESEGWTAGPVVFHVAAPPVTYPKPTEVPVATRTDTSISDTQFTFAVIPDTQPEVHRTDDTRFINRSNWLVANKSKYDIRWAVQTGDMVDWDDETHSQYAVAKAGLAPLKGKIPYFLNIGNHDSAATCPGGSACDGRFVVQMARMTRTFNQYFSVKDYGVEVGSFEPGKVDNTYARFKAGGKFWVLINLELWPRKSVIEWARTLVKRHTGSNVIIATHSFLSASGSLSSKVTYGSTSPQYLWERLIKPFKNVKMVLSGHAGQERTRVLTGSNGNKIYAFLTTYHSKTTNPVRMVEVDVSKNQLRTWIDAPYTKTRLLSPVTYTKLGFI